MGEQHEEGEEAKQGVIEVKSQMQPGHKRGLGTNYISGFVQPWDRGCEVCVLSREVGIG